MQTLECVGITTPAYPLHLSTDPTLRDLHDVLPAAGQTLFVADRAVLANHPDLYALIRSHGPVVPVTATETSKSIEGLNDLLRQLLETAPSTGDHVVIIGGGNILNRGGLAASLSMRGMPMVYVPTTLTGQIDVCIGSKVAVNLGDAKNWVGLYADPVACYINPHFLPSLSDRELLSQAVEGIKLALATDRDLFEPALRTAARLVDRDMTDVMWFVQTMLAAKVAVIAVDLTEEHYGRSMLYGHTLGHVIEMASPGRLTHGEAVALGMLAAARIAHATGVAQEDLLAPHRAVLETLHLPARIPPPVNPAALVTGLRNDKKKRAGTARFALLHRAGQIAPFDGSYSTPVPEDLITTAIEETS